MERDGNPAAYGITLCVYDNRRSAMNSDASNYCALRGYIRSFDWHQVAALNETEAR